MTMALGRNDVCHCGSGRKYKHCHDRIDRAVGVDRYTTAQSIYANNWNSTSQHHFDNGIYHWLSALLEEAKPKRILDIGCGSGHGLAALYEVLGPDTMIVAIDENRACLNAAKRTLKQYHGLDAEVVNRMSITEVDLGYRHVAEPLEFDPNVKCILIESDVCNDQFLADALQASGAFDAVTIWLTGAHMLRQENIAVQKARIKSEAMHRLYVQNNSYELADVVLKVGGLLQIADRGGTPKTDAVKNDIINSHNDQASVTSLEVRDVVSRPYQEPGVQKIPITHSLGKSGEMPADFEPAIVSIVSVKQ